MSDDSIRPGQGAPLVIGAVAYDPKVVSIWEGFKTWFEAQGLPIDYVLYSHYERQVEGHFRGEHHLSWNSPLAWLQAEAVAQAWGIGCRAVAMRDTDRDLTSLVLVRAGGGVNGLEALRGKVVGVGAGDSPQATLIPLEVLARQGLEAGRDLEVRRFDVLLGKHGDHVGGERDAARALMAGEVDAACILDANYLVFVHEGTLDPDRAVVLTQTDPFDHCNFTALDDGRTPPEAVDRFVSLLRSMRYDDAEVRPLLDLEGLKAWEPGRTSGYATLAAACVRTGLLDELVRASERWSGGAA